MATTMPLQTHKHTTSPPLQCQHKENHQQSQLHHHLLVNPNAGRSTSEKGRNPPPHTLQPLWGTHQPDTLTCPPRTQQRQQRAEEYTVESTQPPGQHQQPQTASYPQLG
ncbi:hypothetical protein ILYODFUR_037146 [Ilyodon furcidens]|uniref:Uncharacterized protein n=1 Tax=Ilyodon furcidens TaxID=33524 RepID=A0ABV0U0W2_9TELE